MSVRPLIALVMLSAACSSGSSSKNNDGDSDTTQTGPGDFSSVWQARSTQLTFLDSASPGVPSQQTADVPSTQVDANVGLAVESYLAFDATHLIRYAHYDGEDLYYRITQTATVSADTYIGTSGNYTLQDGALTEYASFTSGTQTLISITTYAVAQFPPSSWPSQVVDYDADTNP